MAHKKGQGSSRNGRDSNAQRLGVKKFGGQQVLAGNVLVRREVQNFIRVLMYRKAAMILYLPFYQRSCKI